MKKFVKLAAVFAALVLALSCFVACSNGDDDSGSNSAAVRSLQGLWIYDDADGNDIDGMYILGNTIYVVCSEGEKYYYDEEGEKFSISGNQVIPQSEDNGEIIFFEINGDTLKITSEYEDKKTGVKEKHVSKCNKKNTVPEKLTHNNFMNKFFPKEQK